jgi:hypothetical protein
MSGNRALNAIKPRLYQCVGALPHNRDSLSDHSWLGDDCSRQDDSTWQRGGPKAVSVEVKICRDPGDGPNIGQRRGARCS